MTISDESLSWGYLLMDYQTPYSTHKMKLHISELQSQAGDWLVPRADSYPETYLLDTLDNFISLSSLAWPSGTQFGNVEVFQNQGGGAPATFFAAFMVAVPTVAPSGTPAAAGYDTFSFRSVQGQHARISMFDVNVVPPQKYTFANLGGSLQTFVNYMLGGALIVTIDGYALQNFQRMTHGFNKHLTAKYGYTIAP